jgi:signal transduction histidine kinase/ActR/RegA family two-component response regulator
VRVLVVEDDPRLCDIFREYLGEIGHEPVIVHTVEDARQALRGPRPGAMLLDLRLPGTSGLDFLQRHGTRELGVPIIVVSGMLTEAEARDCLRLGAVHCLGTPVALEHLRNVLLCLEPLAEPVASAPLRSPERRSAPRARVALPVRVVEYGGNGWDATTVDLSARGVKVRTSGTVSPAAVAKLSFPLGEGQRSFQVVSVLVRADVDGFAFHFINLPDWQQAQLQAFVARNLDGPAADEPHARVLRSLTQAFSGTLDLEETLRLALHALTHVTGGEVSSLHLLSADRQTLQLRGERGMSPELREAHRELPVGVGLIGRVAATGQTARVDEVAASPDLWAPEARAVVAQAGTHGFVCVPLQTRGRIVGTLSLGRLTPTPFSNAEVALLEATANQLALALDNARLYSEARRQLEDLRQAETQAAEGDRLSTVSRLAAGLVHEINNPLAAILGQAHLLMREAEVSPESRERLRVIVQETSRAARLLKSVQGLSRPRRVERRACAIHDEVRTVLNLTQPQRDYTGIRTVMELEPVPPVWADPDQVRQVTLNLLQNAQQAMAGHPGERVLTVRMRAAIDRVLLEVLDTGPGISPDVLPRIFDAFFTTKAAGEGTGLGLWVSYDIAEQHGGRLHAANRPEGGAIFTLELPQRRR